MANLGKLPPIDAVTLPKAGSLPARPPEEQAALDHDLDELHAALGVQRGKALDEALKPKLEVPMPPVQWAVAEPRTPAGSTAATAADTPTAAPADAAPAPVPDQPLLALPAPEDVNSLITLNVSTGQAVTLDHLGPVVVNSDGTLSRITNWSSMTEQERAVTKRRIAKRNVDRLREFQSRGDLKADLASALKPAAEAPPTRASDEAATPSKATEADPTDVDSAIAASPTSDDDELMFFDEDVDGNGGPLLSSCAPNPPHKESAARRVVSGAQRFFSDAPRSPAKANGAAAPAEDEGPGPLEDAETLRQSILAAAVRESSVRHPARFTVGECSTCEASSSAAEISEADEPRLDWATSSAAETSEADEPPSVS